MYLTRKMHFGWMMGMHMGIKTLLMQNLSYTYHLRRLHNNIQNPYDTIRPQRCCHHAFAAHMHACLLNALHFSG
jgi:hypothetical protein